jgi:transposase
VRSYQDECVDLRLKVLDAIDRGIPRTEVVKVFGISMLTLEGYLRRRRYTAEVTPKPSPGRTPSILATSEEHRALWSQLEENYEATLECHCQMWEERGEARVSTMSRAVRKLGWTFKKSRWVPPSATGRSELAGELQGTGARTSPSSPP